MSLRNRASLSTIMESMSPSTIMKSMSPSTIMKSISPPNRVTSLFTGKSVVPTPSSPQVLQSRTKSNRQSRAQIRTPRSSRSRTRKVAPPPSPLDTAIANLTKLETEITDYVKEIRTELGDVRRNRDRIARHLARYRYNDIAKEDAKKVLDTLNTTLTSLESGIVKCKGLKEAVIDKRRLYKDIKRSKRRFKFPLDDNEVVDINSNVAMLEDTLKNIKNDKNMVVAGGKKSRKYRKSRRSRRSRRSKRHRKYY